MDSTVTCSKKELDHLTSIATRKIKRMTLTDVLECRIESTKKNIVMWTSLNSLMDKALVMTLDKADRDLIDKSFKDIKSAVKNLKIFDIHIVD